MIFAPFGGSCLSSPLLFFARHARRIATRTISPFGVCASSHRFPLSRLTSSSTGPFTSSQTADTIAPPPCIRWGTLVPRRACITFALGDAIVVPKSEGKVLLGWAVGG